LLKNSVGLNEPTSDANVLEAEESRAHKSDELLVEAAAAALMLDEVGGWELKTRERGHGNTHGEWSAYDQRDVAPVSSSLVDALWWSAVHHAIGRMVTFGFDRSHCTRYVVALCASAVVQRQRSRAVHSHRRGVREVAPTVRLTIRHRRASAVRRD
jgi:hypothetical protein